MNEANATRDDSARPTPARAASGSTDSLATVPPPVHLGVYRILAPLGQGGMGTVYRAWHTRLKKAVALKTLRTECMDSSFAIARFHREMEVVGKLDHANLIRATDAGEERGIHFLAMDFVEGLDAGKLAQKQGPLPIADACEVVRQAAVGLQYVHEHGLVHRDVKPSNLMVTPAGQVKVLDLGLALLHAHLDETGELTETGQWMGTSDYMAPEQARDAHRVDIRADVYSLGCTLYKLLTGAAPFAGSEFNSRDKKLLAHAQQPVTPLRERRGDAPEALAAVLQRMLAKEPAERFATPGEVARALEPFAAGSDLPGLVSRHQTPEAQAAEPAMSSFGAATAPFDPRTPSASEPEKAAQPLAGARRRWVPVVVSGALVAATFGSLAVAFLGAPCHVSVGTSAPSTVPIEAWQDLLEQTPVQLLWPKPVNNSKWNFHERDRELDVACEGEGLLRLGETASQAYEIEVGIKQVKNWGGVGLFFGYHDDQYQGRACKKYQALLLVSRNDNTPQQKFSIDRLVGYQFDESEKINQTIMDEEVPRPTSQEHRLRIVVGKAGLQGVWWDNVELPKLTAAGPIAPPTNVDPRGAFGVFNSSSTGVYRNARYRTLPENP